MNPKKKNIKKEIKQREERSSLIWFEWGMLT